MHREVLRIQSFMNCRFPDSAQISPIQLAQAGFYTDGRNGRVHCFSCGCEFISGFTSTSLENAHDSNCRRFESNEPMSNWSKGLSKEERTQYFSNQGNVPAIHQNQQHGISNAEHCREDGAINNEATNGTNTGISKKVSANSVLANNELMHDLNNLPRTQINEGSTEASTSRTSASVSESLHQRNGSSQAETVKENDHVSETPTLNLSNVSYPQFSTRQARMLTFSSWNSTHSHRPEDLAEAGFFYAGYADCVRCFCCGLGLKFWRENDIITFQHARLRPHCVFNRLFKGQAYIDNVQQEIQAQQRANHDSNQTLETSSRSAETASTGESCLQDTSSILRAVTTNEPSPSLGSSDSTDSISSEDSGIAATTFTFSGGATALLNDITSSGANGTVTVAHKVHNSVKEPSSSEQATAQTDHKQGAASLNLTEELRVVEREHTLLAERTTCRACRYKPVSCIFLPCGHVAACQECADKVSRCILCEKIIIGTANIFLA